MLPNFDELVAGLALRHRLSAARLDFFHPVVVFRIPFAISQVGAQVKP
jgi:hypothetical protein